MGPRITALEKREVRIRWRFFQPVLLVRQGTGTITESTWNWSAKVNPANGSDLMFIFPAKAGRALVGNLIPFMGHNSPGTAICRHRRRYRAVSGQNKRLPPKPLLQPPLSFPPLKERLPIRDNSRGGFLSLLKFPCTYQVFPDINLRVKEVLVSVCRVTHI